MSVRQPDLDDPLSYDAITADFRIYQRRRGHRYSLDDLATAWEASHATAQPELCVDLGCGIGSVLLMLAWCFPRARLVGVEALAMSAALARRSVASNGIAQRVNVLEGDLREVARAWTEGRAQLVTGTPPYLPLGSALPSPDPQRCAARIELRGGVEAYLLAASHVLAPTGRVVICAGGRDAQRVLNGAEQAGLAVVRRRDVFAREGQRYPLFAVWVLAHAAVELAPYQHLTLVARDGDGRRTAQADALRARFGLPSSAATGAQVYSS